MSMRNRIRIWRRQRWTNEVVRVGRRLRKLQAYRLGLKDWLLPEEARYTDEQINRLERRRKRLLTNLEETAYRV